MKITESRLREIIKEELEALPYRQVIPALKSVVTYADTFVNALAKGERDEVAQTGLEEAAMDLNTVVKLLQRKRAPEAGNMATLARLASELIKRSGFWQTPAFLGKDKHAEELKAHVMKMKKVARQIVASIAAAGEMPRAVS